MKKIILPVSIFILSYGILNAQLRRNAVNISIKNGEVNIGRIHGLADSWNIQNTLDYLGKPAHTRDGLNRLYTYDRSGIVLLERKTNNIPSGNLAEVQLYFTSNNYNDVIPDNGYTGKFMIDKLLVSNSTSLATLKEKLYDYNPIESLFDHNYRMSNNGLYFYFQFNENESELLKVSFGPESD